MWEKQLLLSIILLGLIGGSESESYRVQSKEKKCDYIMSFLPVLRSGCTGTVCINVNCEESVQLDVTFEYESISYLVFNYQISAGTNFFEAKQMDVPIVNKTDLAYVSISIIGETVKKNERRAVAIDNMPTACTFQTEKNLYAPGDTVRFRRFCFDYNMMPIQPKCGTIYFVEPNGARVAEIQDPKVENYMISGEFNVSDEATTGSYRIDCMTADQDTDSTYITVERYVLPRFNIVVSCSNSLSVLDKTAEIKVSAQYVYGEPVKGTVIVKCTRGIAYTSLRTRNCMKGLEGITQEFTRELVSGAWSESLDLKPFKMQFSEYDSSMQCTLTVKEAGTGVLDTKSCYIYITKQPANLQFESYDYQYYKCGIDFPIALILTDEKGKAIANKTLTIEVDGEEIKRVTTDDKGRAECGIDTTAYYKPNITFRACYPDEDQCYATDQSSPRIFNRFGPINPYPYNPDYPCTETLVYRTFSETNSYLQIKKKSVQLSCLNVSCIEVEYKVTEDGVGKGKRLMTVYYMVISKKNIVLTGQKDVGLNSGCRGSFSIYLKINDKYGTEAQLLVYVPIKKEIISDIWQLSINPCSKNQVSLTFPKPVVVPGSNVTQEVSASPGSICALRAWDCSLNLLGYFDPPSFTNLLALVQYYQSGYQVKDFNFEQPTPPCEDPNTIMFCNGRFVQRTSSPTDGDTYNNLLSAGVMFSSNLLMIKPQVCGMEQINNPPSPIFFKTADGLASTAFANSGGGAAPIQTVRKNFNDVFGWNALIIGQDGKAISTAIIPDAITEWCSDAVCISNYTGVGVSNETAKVTTFLTFFVDVTMPKYCTRGETVEVIVTVVNYMEKCTEVNVIMNDSNDYELKPMSDNVGTNCICKGERLSKRYNMTFKTLGNVSMNVSAETMKISDSCHGANDASESPRKDTVIMNINVMAEGIEREDVSSYMNIVKGSSIKNEVRIAEPYNLVANTSETFLSVMGDTVGLMSANLKNLLRQPAGCCEQMLAKILPIYFMRKYFEFAGIIDKKLNEEAKSSFCSGYGSMLACRRWDGQYTLFPNSDMVNSWVLVKTFFAFAKMKEENCYIDDSIQQQALEQLGKLQNLTTGCLTPTGPFLTTSDDTDIAILFTAYVVMHLQQCGDLPGIGKPIMNRAMTCLRNTNVESLGTYALAFVFNAAALCKENDTWAKVSIILKNRAIKSGGRTYWTSDNFPLINPQYVPSSAVDITANVLMGFMWGTKDDLDYLGPIAAWLTSCMNSKGGFSSSQDTMSATQAMTQYARLVYVKNINCEVVASQGGIELARISVTEKNKMLVQRKPLGVTGGIITTTTTGTCACLVQVVHAYNTKVKNDNSSFALDVNTWTKSCTEGVAAVIYTTISIRYTGRGKSNMVYMMMKRITGYTPDMSSVYKLMSDKIVSFVGFGDDRVIFYWPSMQATDKPITFTITSYMANRVPYHMDSTIYVADYYNIAVTASAVYRYSCSLANPQVE